MLTLLVCRKVVLSCKGDVVVVALWLGCRCGAM